MKTKTVKKQTKPDKKPKTKRKPQIRTVEHKKALLKAMVKSLGNVTEACKKAGLNRDTYYDYLKNDKDFNKTVNDIAEMRIDHVEGKLDDLIDCDDSKAIIFFLKTKGKNRGYIERTEIDTTPDNRVTINIVKPEKKIKKEIEPVKPQLGDNLTIYLDIETTGFSKTNDIVTVVGIYTGTHTIQLVNGIDLTEDNLNDIIKRTKRIVSFNGILFDIPFLATKYPNIDFTKAEHKDLRPFCKEHNLTGGLKKIEIELGISRDSGVSDGKEAIELWNKHKAGCKKSLSKLLEYNREDIINLSKIEKILETKKK